jgi:molecular chaperone GrpE
MTEENQTETTERSGSTPDDARFEVKWRKKESTTSTPPPQEQTATATEDIEDLRRQLEEERRRTKDLQDRWHRAQADLANLRKRTEQEREEEKKFASMLLVYEILPVLDNFERAFAAVPNTLMQFTWINGISLILLQLRAILEQQGLKPVEALGQPFNPHFHEAISEKETSEAAPHTVVQEFQRGYTMHGRLLRPALVEVAAAPATAASEEPAPQTAGPEPAASGEAGTSPEPTDEFEGQEIAEASETENTGP